MQAVSFDTAGEERDPSAPEGKDVLPGNDDAPASAAEDAEVSCERRERQGDSGATTKGHVAKRGDGVCCRDTFPVKDGGGVRSTADWFQRPPEAAPNHFGPLRRKLVEMLGTKDFVARIRARGVNPVDAPFFSHEESAKLREIAYKCFSGANLQPSLAVAEGQPFLLTMLRCCAQTIQDFDMDIIDRLEAGVPTGTDDPIPASGCWRECEVAEADDQLSLICCEGNWGRAEANQKVLEDLVQAELDKGFAFIVEGGLEGARKRWPGKVAVGKLGIVFKPGKDPRLTGDVTASGVKAMCRIGEAAEVPTLADERTVLARHNIPGEEVWVMAIDVKGARKTIRVRQCEHGKAMFHLWLRGKWVLIAYCVCHFGAKYSAYWWSRLGALLMRISHHMLFYDHAALLYVDDFKFLCRRDVGPLCGLLALGLFEIVGVPISWAKFQAGSEILWIGLEFTYKRTIEVFLPDRKREKILKLLMPLQKAGVLVKRDELRSLIGMLLWFTNAAETLRPWLYEFYHLLQQPCRRFRLLQEDQLREILDVCDDGLRVLHGCEGCDVPAGWRLKSLAGHDVWSREDCRTPKWKHGACWIRFADYAGADVEVDKPTAMVAALFFEAISSNGGWRLSGLSEKRGWAAAADAYASGKHAGIGGWFTLDGNWPSSPADIIWFAMPVNMSDMPDRWPRTTDQQKWIATLEAIAQWVLLHLRLRENLESHVSLRQHCDNFGVVGASRKLFSTATPLCHALQGIAWECANSNCRLHLTHRCGARNDFADALSRVHDPKHMEFAAQLDPQRCRSLNLKEFLNRPWRMME